MSGPGVGLGFRAGFRVAQQAPELGYPTQNTQSKKLARRLLVLDFDRTIAKDRYCIKLGWSRGVSELNFQGFLDSGSGASRV